MADTLFSDISEYNALLNDNYPYKFVSIRSNDGTYRDKHFAANLAWAKSRTNTGRLVGFAVYFVFEPNWRQTLATFKACVGRPHEKMAVLIDTESWGGRIKGDHSAELNECRKEITNWLRSARGPVARTVDVVFGRQWRRTLGYGNAPDLRNLWRFRGNIRIGLAAYGSNPAFPNKIFHQFRDDAHTAGLPGKTDLNSADGLTPRQFAYKLGLLSTPEAVSSLVREKLAARRTAKGKR